VVLCATHVQHSLKNPQHQERCPWQNSVGNGHSDRKQIHIQTGKRKKKEKIVGSATLLAECLPQKEQPEFHTEKAPVTYNGIQRQQRRQCIVVHMTHPSPHLITWLTRVVQNRTRTYLYVRTHVHTHSMHTLTDGGEGTSKLMIIIDTDRLYFTVIVHSCPSLFSP